MAHGVAVIELSSPGAPPPPYLVFREPYVRICSTEAELGARWEPHYRALVRGEAQARPSGDATDPR